MKTLADGEVADKDEYEPGCYDLGILLCQVEVWSDGNKTGCAFLVSCRRGKTAACRSVTSLIGQDLYEAPEPNTVSSRKEWACSSLPKA